MKILVIYGSRKGSTREVAEEVAAEIVRRGAEALVVDGDEKLTDIKGYDAVVIGGALYAGRLHKSARRFLKRYQQELAQMRVYVFALGPRRDEPEAFDRPKQQLAAVLAKYPGIKPIAATIFGGVDAKSDVDIRDWAAIRAWARDLVPSSTLLDL